MTTSFITRIPISKLSSRFHPGAFAERMTDPEHRAHALEYLTLALERSMNAIHFLDHWDFKVDWRTPVAEIR